MMLNKEQCNPRKPDEHFLWALRALPMFGGAGMVTHSRILRQWSEHLWRCGFAHRDYLEGLADENGNIHVSQLPQQTIKYQAPGRGPTHQYNNAGRWVGKDTPDPEVVNLPDIRQLTLQENMAMIQQYIDAGLIRNEPPGFLPAEVET